MQNAKKITREDVATVAKLIVAVSQEADVDLRTGLERAAGRPKKSNRSGSRFDRALAERIGDSPPPLHLVDGGK